MLCSLRGLAGILLAAGLSSSAVAQDDADTRARTLFDNGAELYGEGAYEQAIIAWWEAYEASERPGLLLNITNAYERLGQYTEAIDTLNRYRAVNSSDAEEREQLSRRLRALERRRDEEAVAVEPSAPVGPSAAEEADVATMSSVTSTRDRRPVSPMKVAGGVLLGGGLASLATGGGLYAVATRQAREAEAECIGGFCTSSGLAGADQAQSLGRGGHIAIGVGAGATATGAVLLLVDALSGPRKGLQTTRVHFDVSPTFGGASASLYGRF